MSSIIPADHSAALDAITDIVMAKWPGCDRAAERAALARAYPSYGLALNHLAHADPSAPDKAIADAARKALTDADRGVLREGG